MYLLQTGLDKNGQWPLVLHEFVGRNVPQYAILSHTWDKDEVLFAHIQDGSAVQRSGYSKIRGASSQARRDGLAYIWIDTCCIDKSSSAELSEAINSMFSWYKASNICYVYLADVPTEVDTHSEISEFTKARWFTRGWCLQELLAPDDLVFFSSDWIPIGAKNSLAERISQITKIEVDILTNERRLESVSVAKRMSWAADRQTTRIEDIAYCLMGLFSVNMSMRYGEGAQAFQRLQEQIMKYSDDHSLFAWVDVDSPDGHAHGLLAESPSAFAYSADIRPYPDVDDFEPFVITNRGLRVDVPLARISDQLFAAVLNCPLPGTDYEGFVGVYLEKLGTGNRQYTRVKCSKLGSLDIRGPPETVYVRQQDPEHDSQPVYPTAFFQMNRNPAATSAEAKSMGEYKLTDLVCLDSSDKEKKYKPGTTSYARKWIFPEFATSFKLSRTPGTLSAALLFHREKDDESFVLLLGSMRQSEVGCDVMPYEDSKLEPLEFMQRYFEPQKPGNWVELDYHRVRVFTNPRVKLGVKLYVVDIEIESILKITPAAVLQGAVDILREPVPGVQIPIPHSSGQRVTEIEPAGKRQSIGWRQKVWHKMKPGHPPEESA